MNDADYTFGDHEDVPLGRDNREEYRLTGSAQVTLELESGLPESGQPPSRTLVSRSCDLSAKGIRLETREALPEGALLPAWVALAGEPEPFALTVEVVWCRASSSGSYLAGLQIVDSDDSSYVDWVEAVARAMGED